ncbi:MAG: hypothetical protein OXI48_06570 [bacterium]|nr:hypothetical protein [bacterium]
MRGRSDPPRRRWTVLSAGGSTGGLAIDDAGRAALGRRGWSLDWEVSAGGHRYAPGASVTLRQRTRGAGEGAPVAIETVLRAGEGDVCLRSYVAVPAGGGGAVGVLEFANQTSAPVALTLTVRPGDYWRPDGLGLVELDESGILANGSRALWWLRPPRAQQAAADASEVVSPPELPTAAATAPQRARSRNGQAVATASWPVTHGDALRVLLPLTIADGSATAPAAVPTLDQVGRGWDLHTASGLRLSGLAEGLLEALVADAVRRLLALDVGPDADAGPDGRLTPPERALAAAALAGAGHPQRAAEVAPARAARSPTAAARLARRELARITAPYGDAATAVREMADTAGAGGGWAGERTGDDPSRRAAFLLAVRETLVREDDGCLDLLGGLDAPEARQSIEVHRLGTGHGFLSFAVRWHNAVPALLWELAPPGTRLESWACALVGAVGAAGAGTGGGAGPTLRASRLSAGWSTTERAGEALLGT